MGLGESRFAIHSEVPIGSLRFVAGRKLGSTILAAGSRFYKCQDALLPRWPTGPVRC